MFCFVFYKVFACMFFYLFLTEISKNHDTFYLSFIEKARKLLKPHFICTFPKTSWQLIHLSPSWWWFPITYCNFLFKRAKFPVKLPPCPSYSEPCPAMSQASCLEKWLQVDTYKNVSLPSAHRCPSAPFLLAKSLQNSAVFSRMIGSEPPESLWTCNKQR